MGGPTSFSQRRRRAASTLRLRPAPALAPVRAPDADEVGHVAAEPHKALQADGGRHRVDRGAVLAAQ